jgi:hypothetical protein
MSADDAPAQTPPTEAKPEPEPQPEPEAEPEPDSEVPAFEKVEGHEFAVGESVFVIDQNGYDIWEAQVVAVVGDKIAVHYPEYPEDDEELTGTDRLLVATDANKAIFTEMEETRKQAEAESEEKRKPRRQSSKVSKTRRPRGARSNPKRDSSRSRKK